MRQEPYNILLVDDDAVEHLLLEDMISASGGNGKPALHLDWVPTYEEALAAIQRCGYDAYLVDYRLGVRDGLQLLSEKAAQECHAPLIMLTGYDNYDVDVAAMELGAADFLVKDQINPVLLERSIRYAIERTEAEWKLQVLLEQRTEDVRLVEKQAQELRALQKATASLLSTLDLPALVGQILLAAREAIPDAEHAWLCLVEGPAWQLSRWTEMELDRAQVCRIQPGQDPPLPIETLQRGEPLPVPDARRDPLVRSLIGDDAPPETVGSAIVAPLVLNGEVLGALCLTSRSPSVFADDAPALLSSFAATATAALGNAIQHSEIQRLAIIDPLTGLFNRRALFKAGVREIERARRFRHPLCAIMFDLDRFKDVNDHYGHSAGDQVLQYVAERCTSLVRQMDVLGRYGGDEFTVLLPEADLASAHDVAERIRAGLSQAPLPSAAGLVTVSASVGLAQFDPAMADLGALLQKADQALYNAKTSGGNAVYMVE